MWLDKRHQRHTKASVEHSTAFYRVRTLLSIVHREAIKLACYSGVLYNAKELSTI